METKKPVKLLIDQYTNFKGVANSEQSFKYSYYTTLVKSLINSNEDFNRKFIQFFRSDISLNLEVINNLAEKYKYSSKYKSKFFEIASEINTEDFKTDKVVIILLGYYIKEKNNYVVSKSLEEVLREVKLKVQSNYLPENFTANFQLYDGTFIVVKCERFGEYSSLALCVGNKENFLVLFNVANEKEELNIEDQISGLTPIKQQYAKLSLNLVLYCANNKEFNEEYNKFAPSQKERNVQEGYTLQPYVRLELEKNYQDLYNNFAVEKKLVHGFFRWQHHGKGNELLKLIFIDPFMRKPRQRIKSENPNYLSSDRYEVLEDKKIIQGVFDVPVLLRKLKHIQRELIYDYDEFYNKDIEAAERFIDSFSESDIARMGVELRSNDEFYYEEVQQKADELIDLLLKYYPEDFVSPYGYFIDWDEGKFVFKITLDEEGRNELIEKYGIDMSELKKSNPDEKKFSASSYLTKKFDLLERVEKLVDHGFEVYSNDYRKSYKKEELAGALLNGNAFITSDLFRYTDYGGAYTLAKANILEIESRYPKLIEDELIEVYSAAHNGQNMEFKFAALANDDLYEDLLGLDGYPVLDDQALSEVEMELEDECWTAYGRDMWKDALIEKYGESAEELSDDDLDNLAYEASQYTCCGRGEVQNMEFSFDIEGMIEGLDKVEEGKKPVKKGNPIPKCENPDWAKDEDIWEKAKKESLKSYGRISYPFVVYLYKQMGGKIKKKK